MFCNKDIHIGLTEDGVYSFTFGVGSYEWTNIRPVLSKL